MSIKHLLTVTAAAFLLAAPAYAQTTTQSDTQRDVNQQDRVEQGLQSGSLSTKEAAHLENGEKRIDNTEARADANGNVSPAEQARITAMQNKESLAIDAQKHDAQTGNPASASSQRMQADVQRDANQETRIENGEKSGALTNKEAGHLQGREAGADKAEAEAGANGKVTAREQARMQRRLNRDSGRTFRQKHDAQATTPTAP